MRQEWKPEDLIEVWTLLEEDQERLRNKSGANRLGFALLLKFFEVEARFPENAEEIPAPAVAYVAQQVKVPAGEWAAYDWAGRAIKRHRLEIRGAFGFRECTAEDQAQLAEWLAVELCGVELSRDRLKRGGQEYAEYLRDGREAAIEALEYALGHGVDAVDEELAAVAVGTGMPITTDDLTEALRRVRDHSLVIHDGSSVAETAYWVADRYWMHRWNNALDQAPIGGYETVVGPNVYKRFALHEWMAPGHSSGSVPGLGYEERRVWR